MHRRTFSIVALVSLAVTLTTNEAPAETAAAVAAKSQHAIDQGDAPGWWAPTLPEDVQHDVDRKGRRLAEGLSLEDEAKTDRVASLVSEHFARVWAWHQQVDDRLDAAWGKWDAARSSSGGQAKDELRALAVMSEQIDPIYAEFAPQIQGLLRDLRAEVGEDKAVELMDRYTRSPGAKRTYDAYVAMVPEMTNDEKAILWDRMAQAREDAMAAWTDGRIIKIFKKYKVRNEFSVDYFGYGYRQRYQEWAARGR